MAERSLLVLGCGTSMGVPMIGCECAVCTSANPRNQRMRPSVLLQVPGGNILIDTGPELRLQLTRARINLVQAVLFTHYHADHLFGLDDVRLFPYKLNGPLPVYAHADTQAVIRSVFSYAFRPPTGNPQLVVPQLELRPLTDEPLEVLGETITPIPLIHGKFHVYGFRISNVAYCTDVSEIPDGSWEKLQNLETLILDCLRPGESHPSHLGLTDALKIIDRLRPKQVYFTHMSHQWDYDHHPELPTGVGLAYDGLRVGIE
jgi:phosphoribosyl 1,2-cyclic phosphate phosphodiesterase